MDCLYSKCIPILTDCVMLVPQCLTVFHSAHAEHRAELEKLGQKYRIALRIARDERWERLKCDHKGVYADDCLVERVQKHKSRFCFSEFLFLRVVSQIRMDWNMNCTTVFCRHMNLCLLGATLTLKSKSTL